MPLDDTGFDPVVQTLREAEAIICRRGWLQGSYGSADGPRCVIGAIQEASIEVARAWSLDLYKLRWDAGYCYGSGIEASSIWCWQDCPGRQLEEILAGFARAIARAIELRVAA
jgi:hypothetical protein